jgi:hypothetical protein
MISLFGECRAVYILFYISRTTHIYIRDTTPTTKTLMLSITHTSLLIRSDKPNDNYDVIISLNTLSDTEYCIDFSSMRSREYLTSRARNTHRISDGTPLYRVEHQLQDEEHPVAT